MRIHNHCLHYFGFCAQCDMVYCKNCGKSWGQNQIVSWGGPTVWADTIGPADRGNGITTAGYQYAGHSHG